MLKFQSNAEFDQIELFGVDSIFKLQILLYCPNFCPKYCNYY